MIAVKNEGFASQSENRQNVECLAIQLDLTT